MNGDDNYKTLAHELLSLADAWKQAQWWKKPAIARKLAYKVWSHSANLHSALIYHQMGMAAIKERKAS